VVGILSAKGKFLGQSLDRDVLIPNEALDRYFGGGEDHMLLSAKPVAREKLDRAIEEITETLRRTRKLRPQDGNDFAVVTQAKEA